MSVINNVLKDLELRSSQFTPIDIAAVNITKPVNQNSWNRLVILLISGVLLGASGYWFYQDQMRLIEDTAMPPIEKTAPIAITKPEPELELEPAPNQIIGLQIKESAGDVSLEFSLREKTVSYLKERSETRFVYHLKNIENEIAAPIIKDNLWIKRLSIIPVGDGVDVAFQTTAGVLVNTEQSQKQEEAIWTIQLEKSPDPVVAEKTKVIEVSEATRNKTPPETIVSPVKTEVVETDSKPVKVEIKSSLKKLSDREQLLRAKELVKNREWKSAETLLQSLIDGPQDLSTRKQLLGVYARPQYASQYASLARESSERYPESTLFKSEYARALFQSQSYRSVISILETPNNTDSKQLALIAASYQRLDEHKQAIEYYRQSLKVDRAQARNWIGLGISLEHNGQSRLALQSYQTAAKLGNISQRLEQFIEQRSRLLAKVVN